MQYVMKRISELGDYLSETSKYANTEMTMVAKMKLIYPPTITNMGRTMYGVIIGGNLARLSKGAEMQKTRLISLDYHLPYLIQYFCL